MWMINTRGLIEVTGVDLRALVRAAYNPSRPQGLGIFAAAARPDLDDKTVDEIVERGRNDRMLAISMDYVNGRSCKFQVKRAGDRLFIDRDWYDHSRQALGDLLEAVGLDRSLIDQAEADWNVFLEEDLNGALAQLRERGGAMDDDMNDEATRAHIYGLYEGERRGLIKKINTENYSHRWELDER